jgi:CHAT domain-containing protein
VLPREIVLHPEGDEVLPRGGVGSSLGAGTVEDGFLTMAEVMGLDLAGCELVVLSCCHSAEGDVAPGAGVMGLAQGFTYAGARGVLASLAKVDDAAALKLMQQFYREWRNGGASKAEALRRAKLALLRSRRYRAPRAWAPFVLYGAE